MSERSTAEIVADLRELAAPGVDDYEAPLFREAADRLVELDAELATMRADHAALIEFGAAAVAVAMTARPHRTAFRIAGGDTA